MMKRPTTIAIIILSALWYPMSTHNAWRVGYDFNIYYQAAKGVSDYGWFYNDKILYLFKPFTLVTVEQAFLFWYALCVFAWVKLCERASAAGIPFIVAATLSAYPMARCLEVGNCTPLLALACTTPLGSILAGCVKPYCFAFVLVHAALYWRRQTVREAVHPSEHLVPRSAADCA